MLKATKVGMISTHLTVPSVCEEEEVQSIEDEVEYKSAGREELTAEPVFSHRNVRLVAVCLAAV